VKKPASTAVKQSFGALLASFDFCGDMIADSLSFAKAAPLLFPDTGP
jgi:hypothetical protein